MTAPLYNLTITIMAQIMGGLIRIYPLRGQLRFSRASVFIFYGCLFLADALVLLQLSSLFPQLDVNAVRSVAEVVASLFAFLLLKDCFYQCLFLVCVSFIYGLLSAGFVNFISVVALAHVPQPLSLWLGVLATVVCTYALLPLVLRLLYQLLSIWKDNRAPAWKIVWVFPVLFFLLSMLTANIFMGNDAVASAAFVLARSISAIGTVATCVLLARALRQEAEGARLVEHARMVNNQLAVQREQFARLAQTAGQEKAARHDLRHHLAALQSYAAQPDLPALNSYLEMLTGSIPAPHEPWCENPAVSAVAGHYLAMAEAAGIRLDVRLDIPPHLERLPDVDLCVVVGNLLENTLEACHRTGADRFIRVRSSRQGDYLSLLVENSFDGSWQEKDGIYYSHKDPHREGVGLSSVRAVCEKYDGLLRIEAGDRAWRVSDLLTAGAMGHRAEDLRT